MRQSFSGRRPAPKTIYLTLAGIGSALVYGAFVLRIPLLRTYTAPLLNLNHIPAADWPAGLLVAGCAALLFGGYLVGALSVSTARAQRLTPLLVVGFPLIFIALLLLAHPMTSTDVYDYLFRGRMLARYEANPFVTTPSQFHDDPLLKYVAWKQAVTAYGPLWERMSWLAARLAGEAPGAPIDPAAPQLLRLILIYKGLAALGFLLCGGAIWLALGRAAPGQRWLGLYLWLWNPLALWETVGAVHNDVWLALCVVLAIWAMGNRRETSGEKAIAHLSPLASRLSPLAALLALTAGGLIKYVAFFFGPLVLAAALSRRPTWRRRLWLLLLGGLACVALVVAAYAPFWAGWPTLQNVGDRRALYTASWLAALHAVLRPALSEQTVQTIIAIASLALLLAGVAWASWRAWRAPGDLPRHALWLALWFLLVCNPWFQPWYVIWPLALAAVQPWRGRVVWAVALFSFTALTSYVVGGLAAPALGLADKSLGREGLMWAYIYLPPLIVLGWGALQPRALWHALRQMKRADQQPMPQSSKLRTDTGTTDNR